MKSLGVSQIYGISTQTSTYQAEVHKRLHLPYDLLSDRKLELQGALRLPTFEWEGKKVLKRVTMAVEGGRVVRVWYPVFPPDEATREVVGWLRERRAGDDRSG
jgi:peroxiredoxin